MGVDVRGITADSRAVKPGYMFAALPGTKVDGRHYIADAVARLTALAARCQFVDGRISNPHNKAKNNLQASEVDPNSAESARIVAEAFATDDRQLLEERAAARFAQRKRIGPWRRLGLDPDIEREIAALARGGFDISLARRIVTGDRDEIEALLEI